MPDPRLIYVANNRLPTEKAHGLQIVQMCEALAETGYAVTLVAPRRFNTPEMRAVRSLWDHYGVVQNFEFRRLWCLDLFPLFPRYHIAFLTQTLTYLAGLLVWLLFRRVDVLYTRDLFAGVVLALAHPHTRLVYEVHQVHSSWLGQRAQGFLARRAQVVAITGHLADRMRALGASRVLVAHDGIRAARFANVPSRAEARSALDIPPAAFVVGYLGRLHTMEMPKGLDTFVNAIACAVETGAEIDLLLVGGPEASAAALRAQWIARGLPPARLHTAGQVAPDAVPRYLAAMDVGVLPLPWTEHFAYHASALKLFEYMAAGCAVVASDLPSTAEVLRDGETGLLVPPGDATAFADALQRLYADRDLCRRLGEQARIDVQQYTWSARAARIRAFIEDTP
jgi:glycosyltransferase involved in cell wall biosynthesis